MSNFTHNVLVRTAFVAVLVAVSGAAGAAPIKPPAGAIKPPVETGTTPAELALHFEEKTCTAADDRAAIAQALTVARERVAAGLQVATQSPNDPHIARWFGNARRDRVTEVLRAVLAKINAAATLTIGCRTRECEQGQSFAYTYPRAGYVAFCERFFRADLTGEDSRFGTVVHELSHVAAGTDDVELSPGVQAYGRRNATLLASQAPDRAANNADNYEYFIETLAE
jgi:peptidyl-Lys metalloendopeptidase